MHRDTRWVALGFAFLMMAATPLSRGAEAPMGAPIRIVSNSQLVAMGLPGNGSRENPYRLTNFSINAASGDGILVGDTTLWLRIENGSVTQGGASYGGLALVNATHVLVDNVTVTGSLFGVSLENSHADTISNVTIQDVTKGILLSDGSSDNDLVDNQLYVSGVGIELTDAAANTFARNSIQMAGIGTGFMFDDPTSYDNAIPPSNRVNGDPMEWITGAESLSVGPVHLTVRSVNNVANVFISHSLNISLHDVTVSAPATVGVEVVDSQDISLDRVSVSCGDQAGFVVAGSEDVAIAASSSSLNGGDGIAVSATHDLTVNGTNASANRGAGLRLTSVSPARVRLSTFAANALGGLEVQGSSALAIDQNLFRANGAAAILLQDVTANVTANRIESANRGIEIGQSAGGWFANNSLTVEAGIAFFFDDTASYRNSLPPSNTVNGQPLRWYVDVAHLTLDGIQATAATMTNVAQVFILGSREVHLTNVSAANGAVGLRIERSLNVSLVNGGTWNTSVGISLLDDRGVVVTGMRADHDGAGIAVADTTQSTLTQNPSNASEVGIEIAGESRQDQIFDNPATDDVRSLSTDGLDGLGSVTHDCGNLLVDTASERSGIQGTPIAFNASTLVGPACGENTMRIRWDFGDGTNASVRADNASVVHTYARSGSFVATLDVITSGHSWLSHIAVTVFAAPNDSAELPPSPSAAGAPTGAAPLTATAPVSTGSAVHSPPVTHIATQTTSPGSRIVEAAAPPVDASTASGGSVESAAASFADWLGLPTLIGFAGGSAILAFVGGAYLWETRRGVR
ncbi:MAG: right-handed parallel beta-helix repeat-containing protein [Thermoplasmatota archaeon]